MSADASAAAGAPPPERDVGLGTAYERLAVYGLLRRWAQTHGVRTALEGPVDGMAGMPGLHLLPLAREGVRVTVASPDAPALERVREVYERLGCHGQLTTVRVATPRELPEGADLVLSFNALPLVEDWSGYLKDLASRAGRLLALVITNPSSYGVAIRKVMRLLEKDRVPELFDHPATRAERLLAELSACGEVEVLDRTYVDCPWWPDLFVPTGQTTLQGILGRLPFRLPQLPKREARPAGFIHGTGAFPLLEGEPGHDQLRAALRWHPTFDGLGPWLGRAFGHHHAFLVRRREAMA
jgi:hypothetical protein